MTKRLNSRLILISQLLLLLTLSPFLSADPPRDILQKQDRPDYVDSSTEQDQVDDEYDDDYYDEDDYDEYEDELEGGNIRDPLHHFNFVMFKINDRLYFWLLKPIAKGYSKVLPEKGRVGVKNFFFNLSMPVRFVNCLLQRKGRSAGDELKAFAVNSTVGILGFRNPAKTRYHLEYSREDLGQTLAVYGVGHGFYLVIPLLGPSSLKDLLGKVGDGFLTPINYLPTFWRIGVNSYQTINSTSLKIGEYEQVIKSAISPYESIRNIYVQYRAAQISQ